MNITLNIGLDISQNYLPEGVAGMQLQYEYVMNYLEKTIGKPSYIGLTRSVTEDTVVVQYKNVERTLYTLYNLATALQQDCIAYSIKDDDGKDLGGALVGKFAHEWNYGLFVKEYFVEVL